MEFLYNFYKSKTETCYNESVQHWLTSMTDLSYESKIKQNDKQQQQLQQKRT